MSLAEASEARKARLVALRRRKAGEESNAYALQMFQIWISCLLVEREFRDEPVIKNRNFDPTTRTLRKHDRTEDDTEDTVEKNVDGLAEEIIAEDEERRAQELVCRPPSMFMFII